MAGESYYYCFSLVFTLSAILCILSLLLLRKGKTLFGITVKRGTPEYERGVKFASNRNIVITIILTLIFIGNLIYDVNRLMRLDEYRQGGLLLLTAFVLLLFILIIPVGRHQARSIYELGKSREKK
jgi:hypothetical protein